MPSHAKVLYFPACCYCRPFLRHSFFQSKNHKAKAAQETPAPHPEEIKKVKITPLRFVIFPTHPHRPFLRRISP
jgi:hypothetical protein